MIEHIAKIRPSSIIVFKKFPKPRKPKQADHNLNASDDAPKPDKGCSRPSPAQNMSGRMTPSAAKRAKKYIRNWIESVKCSIKGSAAYRAARTAKTFSFVTLTLPSKQQHDDEVIKRELLNHFLITAARAWDVQNYLWRAEPQENGNIHFHILCDRYIDKDELRIVWNSLCEKLGYLSEFQRLNGDKQPPSTDIHALYKVKNISSYITKYMSKNDDSRRALRGRVWGCSDSIKHLTDFEELLAAEELGGGGVENEELTDFIKKLKDERKICKEIKEDYVEILIVDGEMLGLLWKFAPELRRKYEAHHQAQRPRQVDEQTASEASR